MLIFEKVGINILFKLYEETSYHHIKERLSGVFANLTQLETENCAKLAKLPSFVNLFKEVLLNYSQKKFEISKNLLMMIANVFDVDKSLSSLIDCFEFLLDCEREEINCQVVRIYSNIIGYTKEWLTDGYKPTEGLKKI